MTAAVFSISLNWSHSSEHGPGLYKPYSALLKKFCKTPKMYVFFYRMLEKLKYLVFLRTILDSLKGMKWFERIIWDRIKGMKWFERIILDSIKGLKWF
jgi:hypothetical protein